MRLSHQQTLNPEGLGSFLKNAFDEIGDFTRNHSNILSAIPVAGTGFQIAAGISQNNVNRNNIEKQQEAYNTYLQQQQQQETITRSVKENSFYEQNKEIIIITAAGVFIITMLVLSKKRKKKNQVKNKPKK